LQSPGGEWGDFEISPPAVKKYCRKSGFWQKTGFFFASSRAGLRGFKRAL
jgi:hypothetical protein